MFLLTSPLLESFLPPEPLAGGAGGVGTIGSAAASGAALAPARGQENSSARPAGAAMASPRLNLRKRSAETASYAAPEAAAEPIVPVPPVPSAKSFGGKNDSSKSDVNKNNANKIDAKKSGDAKAQLAVPPAGAAAPAKPRRAREDLNGAPRPPMPIAPSRD